MAIKVNGVLVAGGGAGGGSSDGAAGGVTSFKGRTGAVTPQSGDYTTSMVGALPAQTGKAGQLLGFTAANKVGAVDAPPAGVGQTMTGKTLQTSYNVTETPGQTAEAVEGAEILGDYGERTYNESTGIVVGGNVATGRYSLATGRGTTVTGNFSYAGGLRNHVSSARSFAFGYDLIVQREDHYAFGRLNVPTTTFPSLILGNGTSQEARANGFRVWGHIVYAGEYNSEGADYAEYFEWADGNPDAQDRAGLFVTLEGDKIRVAGPEDDYIVGIVSANPSVCGDSVEDQWHGIFLRDVFGRLVLDEQGERIVNPEYNHELEYVGRSRRPEWSPVGLMGKLVAVDDGTCEAGGWCQPGENGVATRAAERTKYRVMARLDESHIRVLIL